MDASSTTILNVVLSIPPTARARFALIEVEPVRQSAPRRPDRYHLAAADRWGIEVLGPRRHQSPPLLNRTAAPVGRLNVIRDGVAQRGLGDLAREMRAIPAPVSESRSGRSV